MTPISITFSTAGADEVGGALAMMDSIASDWRGAWPAVAARLRRQIREDFDSEGAGGRSGKWARLSKRYRRWKERHYPGRKILELTYRLRDSLTAASHPDAVEIRDAAFLFFGSSVPYAGYHQSGTEKMPRRPPISPTDRDVYEWVVEMRQYMDGALRRRVGQSTGRLATAFR